MSLLAAATDVRDRAYAPYSRFKVGAAIRGASGAIYSGCNVENVAYPEGTCAEAGAIAAMIAAGDTRIAEIHVIADSPDPVRLGGVGHWLQQQLQPRVDSEVRTTLLGHVQRGGTPTAFDRVLATRFGHAAAQLAMQGGGAEYQL